MTARLVLVPIHGTEREELLDVCRRYWLELMPHWRGNRDPDYQATYFDDRFRLGDPRNEHWWGVVDGTRIGFARVELHADVDGPWASVNDFYVEPEQRRRGYGRALAGAVTEELRGRGCRRIDLNVRADNPGALAFWQTAGFELASYRLRTYL